MAAESRGPGRAAGQLGGVSSSTFPDHVPGPAGENAVRPNLARFVPHLTCLVLPEAPQAGSSAGSSARELIPSLG